MENKVKIIGKVGKENKYSNICGKKRTFDMQFDMYIHNGKNRTNRTRPTILEAPFHRLGAKRKLPFVSLQRTNDREGVSKRTQKEQNRTKEHQVQDMLGQGTNSARPEF